VRDWTLYLASALGLAAVAPQGESPKPVEITVTWGIVNAPGEFSDVAFACIAGAMVYVGRDNSDYGNSHLTAIPLTSGERCPKEGER
jgi:hypothetical protein